MKGKKGYFLICMFTGSSQNSDPILIPRNMWCRNIISDRNGTLISGIA